MYTAALWADGVWLPQRRPRCYWFIPTPDANDRILVGRPMGIFKKLAQISSLAL